MNSSYLIIACLFLIALAIRTSYEILKKAGRINSKNVALFIVVLTAMCLLWASWFSLCPRDPLPLTIPNFVRWLGLAVLIIGLGLAIGALIQLRGVENIDHLVTTGLFAKIRHPMYLGFILWIFGWAIYHSAAISLVIGFVGIANILYWRHLEEVHLEASYSDEYRQYRERTWF